MESRMNGFGRKILKWVFVLQFVVMFDESSTTADGMLSVDYYKKSCPNLERIVQQTMEQKFNESPVVAPGILRLLFHDCMVEGCDASVMIASTEDNIAEKDSAEDLPLPGDAFDAVIRAKAAVEAQCPGVVSCADLIVIASRDLLGMIGGPFWEVAKGRLDGKVSMASRVAGNLPSGTDGVDKLTALFTSKGLTQAEMVTLAGAHTVGFVHCKEFMSRIYPSNNNIINSTFAAQLRGSCPQLNLDPTVVVFLDQTTPRTFDNVFYKNAQKGLAVLSSDQALFSDRRTRPLVDRFAGNNKAFFDDFVKAMHKLTSIGVKTGSQGEIRQNCAAFNAPSRSRSSSSSSS